MLLLITCRISLPFPSQIQQKTLYTQMQMTLLSRGYPPGKLLSWSIQARDMHLYVIMFPCMYRGCREVTVPTFMFTDSADSILLAGQAKHFISTISVKEAVDLAYSVQIRPSFAAYTHWAIIPWHTYLNLVAPTSPSTDPVEDTLLAELDDSLIRFSRALFNEMSETVCSVQIRKDYRQFIHILILL